MDPVLMEAVREAMSRPVTRMCLLMASGRCDQPSMDQKAWRHSPGLYCEKHFIQWSAMQAVRRAKRYIASKGA